MALYKSKQVVAGVNVPTCDDSYEATAITAEYVTPTGGIAAGSIIEFGGIPDGTIPVDLVIHTGALGASVTLDSGILSGAYGTNTDASTMGSEFFTAAQAAATAVLLRATKSMAALPPKATIQSWGVKTAGATTSAGITIRATLFVVPAPIGMANA